MPSIGETLRAARQSQKRDLAQIADELCISISYLKAVEKDDLKSLPGAFFYKSFVRQYAASLGLDYNKLRGGVDAVTALGSDEPAVPMSQQQPLQPMTRFTGPIRVPDPILEAANKLDISGRSLGLSVAGLAAALLVCSSFYSWWNHRSGTVPDAPEQSSANRSIESRTVANTSGSGANSAEPTIDVTSSTGPDGVPRVVLNLSATETTWLSITSEGKVVFEGKLNPSESKTLEGLQVAKLKVGNAGGLDVRWNGKEIGPIGKSGQVRTVLLAPDGKVEILTEVAPRTQEVPTPATL